MRPEKDRQFRDEESSDPGIPGARSGWQSRPVRRTALVLTLLAGLAVPTAHAANMTVSGTVAPLLGLSLDSAAQGGTVPADVTTEQRGDLTIVTVFPR
jgi:hypothetical protein